jgi:hypothetical protein
MITVLEWTTLSFLSGNKTTTNQDAFELGGFVCQLTQRPNLERLPETVREDAPS